MERLSLYKEVFKENTLELFMNNRYNLKEYGDNNETYEEYGEFEIKDGELFLLSTKVIKNGIEETDPMKIYQKASYGIIIENYIVEHVKSFHLLKNKNIIKLKNFKIKIQNEQAFKTNKFFFTKKNSIIGKVEEIDGVIKIYFDKENYEFIHRGKNFYKVEYEKIA